MQQQGQREELRSPEIGDAIFSFLTHCDLVKRLRSETLKAYRFDLLQFQKWIVENTAVRRVGQFRDLTCFLAFFSCPRIASSSGSARVARIISVLKNFFAYLHESGFIESNPAANLSKPKIRRKVPRFCDVTECRLLLSGMHRSKPRAIVALLLYTGLRVSEIARLRYSDLNFRSLRIKVDGKGGQERVVPFNSVLISHLKPYCQGREGKDYLFPGQCTGRHLSTRSIQRIVRKSAARAGITGKVSPHSLRHSYATALIDAGNSVVEVQGLLGHASLRTTQIYVHSTGKRLRAAADSLDFG